jgi:uncharacterized protein (TIGR02679 family)
VLTDPHALDRDQPAGRAFVRIAAATFTLPTADTADPGDVAGFDEDAAAAAAREVLRAREWRTVWARVGITCDQVSSTVLLLPVPVNGPTPALTHVTATRGEPVWVTARMTGDTCTVADTVRTGHLLVRVCENPSVVEAAAQTLGETCPPLVCLYGRPSGAAWAVLAAVAAAGGTVLLSSDRDDAGNQIAADVTRELSAHHGPGCVQPWLPDVAGMSRKSGSTHSWPI